MATASPRTLWKIFRAPTAIKAPPTVSATTRTKAAVAICCGVKKALNRFIL